MTKQLANAAAAFVLVTAFATAAGATSSEVGAPIRAEPRGVQLAGLFGESDADKAARLQHEADQDAQISDLKQRVHDLEQSLQQITGQNEQLGHRIQELSDRVDRQKKDFDYKLCSLAAQQLGAGSVPGQSDNALPCDTNAALAAVAAPAGQMAPSGGVLGTLPRAMDAPDAKPQYDAAMNLLSKAQYDEARAAFRSFADAYSKDALAPQAVYWVGDIAYVQKDYAGAAQAFAEQIKKYPTSPRSPDSMLKLGQALLALGQKKEGCLTLGAIKSKYSQASASVLSQAATARAGSCK